MGFNLFVATTFLLQTYFITIPSLQYTRSLLPMPQLQPSAVIVSTLQATPLDWVRNYSAGHLCDPLYSRQSQQIDAWLPVLRVLLSILVMPNKSLFDKAVRT